MLQLIADLGKPTICAAQGHVLAVPLGLALACDLVVASKAATFGTPEINVGAFPFKVTALLYRNIGRKGYRTPAHRQAGRGRRSRAHRSGELRRTYREFDDVVEKWANGLNSKSPLLVKLGKDAIRRQADMAFDDALEFLRGQLTLALASDDLREGGQAFFDKRPPAWTGR